ncbi:phage tail tube protein [uncultured Roseibium sp.]|uniref:phage tail tube protein n=1 Tax=uncultured Roseibium sp. TaxID=1936171 RepID=UPI0026026E18|nr:phage tail tube protein [uncultured Roseibium sp.]
MSTNLSIGHGTAFQRSDDGTISGNFAAIGEIFGISGPGLTRETADVTDFDSADRWREFIGALKDGGEITLETGFNPDGTDVTNWLSDINTDTAGYYKLVFPDTTSWGFSALMTGFEPATPLDDKMTASVTYKLTGKPSFIS